MCIGSGGVTCAAERRVVAVWEVPGVWAHRQDEGGGYEEERHLRVPGVEETSERRDCGGEGDGWRDEMSSRRKRRLGSLVWGGSGSGCSFGGWMAGERWGAPVTIAGMTKAPSGILDSCGASVRVGESRAQHEA